MGEKFREEGKLPKYTKLNKKKDELVKLLVPFDKEIKTVEKEAPSESHGEKDVEVEKEEEKYEYGMKLQFIDSFSFLSFSLDKLVEHCI